MRLNGFQWTGVAGILLVFLGGMLGIVLPQMYAPGTYSDAAIGVAILGFGGILVVVGIVGNLVRAVYGAAARRDRRGPSPPAR